MQYPHNLHFIILLDEEDQITAMGRVAQTRMQVVTPLEAARACADLHSFCLDLGHERRCTGRVFERNEVTNIDEVCPCGGQDNQLCHGQVLSA